MQNIANFCVQLPQHLQFQSDDAEEVALNPNWLHIVGSKAISYLLEAYIQIPRLDTEGRLQLKADVDLFRGIADRLLQEEDLRLFELSSLLEKKSSSDFSLQRINCKHLRQEYIRRLKRIIHYS